MEEELMKTMIKKARSKHERIFPCGSMKRIEDCFTIFEDHLVLWYNTIDRNTHMIVEPRYSNGNKISLIGAR